eukprot:scaffold168163_cov32-Tisochrysis_lutea.AAC.3
MGRLGTRRRLVQGMQGCRHISAERVTLRARRGGSRHSYIGELARHHSCCQLDQRACREGCRVARVTRSKKGVAARLEVEGSVGSVG